MEEEPINTSTYKWDLAYGRNQPLWSKLFNKEMVLGQLAIQIEKVKWDPYPMPNRNINFKWFKALNMKEQNLKFLEENVYSWHWVKVFKTTYKSSNRKMKD